MSELHRFARQYELDLNDFKTDVVELPEPLEPYWKTQLRAMELRQGDNATSVKALFDRGAELAKEFPQDSVLTYVVKKVETSGVDQAYWPLCEALLFRAAIGEPSCLPTVLRICSSVPPSGNDTTVKAVEELCQHHSVLQQSSEVAWALWAAKQLEIDLSEATANAISAVDDDIVALLGLDLYHEGRLPLPDNDFQVWKEHMTGDGLYQDHWLLAYEAYEQGWLKSFDGSDYIANDQWFSLLRKHGVRFYDPATGKTPEDTGYNSLEDDEAPFLLDTEEDEYKKADELPLLGNDTDQGTQGEEEPENG